MVVSEGAINNIMGGMENTSGVRLHSHRHKLKQRFDIVRKLGQGTYGKVQLAINKETGQEVAIKTIKKAKIETEQDLVRIRREIQIMSSVQHPQIIHIYEVFENREKMVLVMEYAAGGELYDYLSERKVLAADEARRVFRQVASAVYYCHKHKICHRDLKLENILLDLKGNAKIADFGLSNVFDEKQRLDTFCGSPLYASPEIVKGVPYVGPEVDCWSLGVLLYTLVYGAMPFDGTNFRRLVKQITQGDFYEPSTPATASELIRHMLTVQSTDRATVEDICSHWWVNEGYPVSCLAEAEDLAAQTPVRLDLLLSLAPKQISSEHMVIQPEDDQSLESKPSSPPQLKIPPPPSEPAEDSNTNVSVPSRSHSLGAVSPSGPVGVDVLVEKKMEQQKEGPVKKPPSVPSGVEEKRTVKKKETSIDKDRVKKREASAEREKIKVKKRETSTEKEKGNVREMSVEKQLTRERDRSADRMKKKESSPVTMAAEKRSESKDNRTEEMDIEEKKNTTKRNSSASSKSSVKGLESATVKPSSRSSSFTRSSLKSQAKTDPSFSKDKVNQANTNAVSRPELSKSRETEDTEKILKETAAKIERVEHLIKAETDKKSSPVVSTTVEAISPVSSHVTSSRNSISSSQAPSPTRSRTGSESSSDVNRSGSKSETGSRRHSKIFSKAAMFEPGLAQPSPSLDKIKKPNAPRPGALNMSDLAKKFEEKPSPEKKNRVVAPYKVSDAKKIFEAKNSDGSRRVSVGSNGTESASNSPKDSVPTTPKESIPTTPDGEKTSVLTTSTSKITGNDSSPTAKSTVNSPKAKSDPKQSKEKSPGREKSPSVKPVLNHLPRDSSLSKMKETKNEPEHLQDRSSIIESKSKTSIQIPSKPKSSKLHETSDKSRVVSKRSSSPTSRRKVEPNDSSESESEAEKLLKEVAEKRERLETAKKAKLKAVPNTTTTDEASTVSLCSTTTSETKGRTKEEANNKRNEDHKSATLPRGFKSIVEPGKGQNIPSRMEENAPSSIVRRIPVAKEVVAIPPAQVLSPTPRTEYEAAGQIPTSLVKRRDSSGGASESCQESPTKKAEMEIVLSNRGTPLTHQPSDKSSVILPPQQNLKSKPQYRAEIQGKTSDLGAPPEPHLQRARRERIIPIMLEEDYDDTPESDVRSGSSHSSMTSVASSVKRIPDSSHSTAMKEKGKKALPSASTEVIKKSRRERIIPIAVEGEGLVSPPISECGSTDKFTPFQRHTSSQGSFSRNRGFALNRNESFSSAGEDEDDEDDGFQIVTAESLFSTLLSRVRSLTRKMAGDDGRVVPISHQIHESPGTTVQLRSESQPSSGSSGNAGFWSSLHSPPREMVPTSRRITEALSRDNSREADLLSDFSHPFWGRSISKDNSDADSNVSDQSGPFSTLPRGWRARRTGREESGVTDVSFTPPRRHFYSRTLSRDLPFKSRRDARSSWDASSSDGTLPKPSSTLRQTLPTNSYTGTLNRVTPIRNNSCPNNTNSKMRMDSINSKVKQSTDAILPQHSRGTKGKVGVQDGQLTYNITTSPISSNTNQAKHERPSEKESMQQLMALVNELESVPEETHGINEKHKEVLNSDENFSKIQRPIQLHTSLTNTGFEENQSPLISQNEANQSIQAKTKSFPQQKKTPEKSTSCTLYLTQNTSPHKSNHECSNNNRNMNASSKSDNKSRESGPRNTFIPFNHTSSFNTKHSVINSMPINVTQSNNNLGGNPQASDKINIMTKYNAEPNQNDSNNIIRNKQKIEPKPLPNINPELNSGATITNNGSNTSFSINPTNSIKTQPYRKGRSDDLQATIAVVNSSDARRPLAFYRSKSRDITPIGQNAADQFSYDTSENMRSNFKSTCSRSQSREFGRDVDFANNDSSTNLYNHCNNRMKSLSPLPSTLVRKKNVLMSPFEKAKISIEKQMKRSKTPPLEQNLPNKNLNKSLNAIVALPNEDIIEPEDEKSAKEFEKPKSMYKILASKFSRSVSNLGEDKFNNKELKNTEESSEYNDKFRLTRPSRYLKGKIVPSSSKTSVFDIEEDTEKSDKKSKISSAINKFLGRKTDDVNAKNTAYNSTLFGSNKFRKNYKLANKNEGENDENASPENEKTINQNQISETHHHHQIKSMNQPIKSLTQNINERFPYSLNESPQETYINNEHANLISTQNGNLSPNVTQQKMDNLSPCSDGLLYNDICTDRYVSERPNSTPDTMEAKETNNESMIDRITRKSYYSRFNENKHRPKSARIDTKESEDEQLAAAKARLFQEQINSECFNRKRESLSPSRKMHQKSLTMTTSPPNLCDSVVKRSCIRNNVEPRVTSFPPEDGSNLYTQTVMGLPMQYPMDGANSLIRNPSLITESSAVYAAHSLGKDDPRSYRRKSSAVMDDSLALRRLSLIAREDPNSCVLSYPTLVRDNTNPYSAIPVANNHISSYARYPPIKNSEQYVRYAPMTNNQSTPYHRAFSHLDNYNSTIPHKDSLNMNRLPLLSDHVQTEHRSQYYNSAPFQNGITESERLGSAHQTNSIIDSHTENRKSPSKCSTAQKNFNPESDDVESNINLQGTNLETFLLSDGTKWTNKTENMPNHLFESPQNIPQYCPPVNAIAFNVAREELNRCLTPLTHKSFNRSRNIPTLRPYRKTYTMDNLPLHYNQHKETNSTNRFPYKRNLTIDLPSNALEDNRGRLLQDSGQRNSDNRSKREPEHNVKSSESADLPPDKPLLESQ